MKGWWKSIAFWIWVLSVMLCSNVVWETFEASSWSLKLYTEADCQLCPWVTRTLIEVVSHLIKFLSTGTYAVNYLLFCSCVVFVIMNKVSMNEKISLLNIIITTCVYYFGDKPLMYFTTRPTKFYFTSQLTVRAWWL